MSRLSTLLPATMMILLMSTSYAQKGPLLLVVNQTDQSLSIVDPNAAHELARVKTNDVRGHEVIASPDGHFAYVPIYGDSGVGLPGSSGHSIEIIDLATRKVTGTIDLGRPVRPHCAKFGPDGFLYVSAELDNAIDIVDPHTRKLLASIPTERPQSHMFVISNDGKRAYTSNVDSGTVTVLDLTTGKPVTVISVSAKAQRITISNDDRYVFTADQTQPNLAAIDTRVNKVTRWIPLPSIGYGSAPTPDGKFLLVTMPSAGKVAVVDLEKMTVANTIPVGKGPAEILIRPDKPIAYVSCTQDGAVAVVDLTTWKVLPSITTASGADGLAWASPK